MADDKEVSILDLLDTHPFRKHPKPNEGDLLDSLVIHEQDSRVKDSNAGKPLNRQASGPSWWSRLKKK